MERNDSTSRESNNFLLQRGSAGNVTNKNTKKETKNTSYKVVPDNVSTSQIEEIKEKEGAITYDVSINKPRYYNGTSWITFGEGLDTLNSLFSVESDDDGDIVKVNSVYDMKFPSESIEIGDSVKISDLGQAPSYTTKFDDKQYLMMGYEFGGVPDVKELSEESLFELQSLDDESVEFSSQVEFNITSQQDVIGEAYTMKLFSKEDVRFRVYRIADNGGEESMLVDKILLQETLSIDGFTFNLSPIVDFAKNKVYKLVFSSEAEIITIKGTEIASASQYGVSNVTDTQFYPFIKREVGRTYVKKNLTHLDYENKRVAVEPYSNKFDRLIVLKEHHKKRIIVSADLNKIEIILPILSALDDGWTCQITNLGEKSASIGGYIFKKGGSITLVYLAQEDKLIPLSFEAYGDALEEPDLINVKDVSTQVYDVLEENKDYLINMQFNGDWAVNLPDISEVGDNFSISIIHKEDEDFTGTIIGYGSDLIDGDIDVNMFGQGLITLRKALINEEYQWFVINRVSYNTVKLQGKTRRLDFVNQSTVQLQHDLGFIPIVQVWLEDGEGGYVEVNVDIDHDWDTMNSFQVEFGTQETGKIIY